MTKCSCWMHYPNKLHKNGNRKWKCVESYRCVKDLREENGKLRKTQCVRIEDLDNAKSQKRAN